MTTIKISEEKLSELVGEDIITEGYNFGLDGEEFEFIEELDEDMDDNGKYRSYVYQRKSDAKYFMIEITFVRYGYEWYEFDKSANNGELVEVERKEVVTIEWEAVK